MQSRRLPWLVAVPLMAAGAFAARAATYVCVPPAGGEHGNEVVEHVEGGATGSRWPLVTGVLAALVVFALVAQAARLVRGRSDRDISAWAFFTLPPLAFLLQELVERLLHSEPGLGSQGLGRIGIGLALQLPFALAAFLLASVLLTAAKGIARALGSLGLPTRPFAAAPLLLLGRTDRPSRTLLALGHPQRGPPHRV